MPLYSIKMRASKGDLHVSGAERIIPQADISSAVSALTERALHHGLGRADFINVKMEEVAPEKLQYLDALPVSKRPADTVEETYKIMKKMLCELGLEAKADALIDLLRHNHPIRGAVLYDVATNSRLEPDHERGIRVTYMDAEGAASNCSGKNHFREAIVLATKVVNAPGIIAELCLSDDPDYLVGYLASLKHGYVRLMPMKEMGNPHGGRVFIFDSTKAKAEDAINYLEKQRVLVRGLPVEKPANPNPEQIFADELKQLKEQNLYRSLRTMDSEQSKYIEMQGRKVLMLASNSYLDLAADTRVKQAAAEAAAAKKAAEMAKWGPNPIPADQLDGNAYTDDIYLTGKGITFFNIGQTELSPKEKLRLDIIATQIKNAPKNKIYVIEGRSPNRFEGREYPPGRAACEEGLRLPDLERRKSREPAVQGLQRHQVSVQDRAGEPRNGNPLNAKYKKNPAVKYSGIFLCKDQKEANNRTDSYVKIAEPPPVRYKNNRADAAPNLLGHPRQRNLFYTTIAERRTGFRG
jgi:6-carboxyhexanoate--CoA ligase